MELLKQDETELGRNNFWEGEICAKIIYFFLNYFD
jgi:hypothetical protein